MLIILPNSCLDTIDEDNNFSLVVAKRGGFLPTTHKLTPHIKGKKMQKKKKEKKAYILQQPIFN
jgi:hypothetical protein